MIIIKRFFRPCWTGMSAFYQYKYFLPFRVSLHSSDIVEEKASNQVQRFDDQSAELEGGQ